MSTFSRFLVITSLVAALSGCQGSPGADIGQREQAVHHVDANSLPADLMSCDDFYGDDWDTPDAILIVVGRTGQVVLVQADEMVCSGSTDQLETRFHGVNLGTMLPIDGEGETPQGGTETGMGDGTTDSPVADSNPLPAIPVEDDSGAVADSNPLPAMPVDDDSGTAEDSNPLPAYEDDDTMMLYIVASHESER